MYACCTDQPRVEAWVDHAQPRKKNRKPNIEVDGLSAEKNLIFFLRISRFRAVPDVKKLSARFKEPWNNQTTDENDQRNDQRPLHTVHYYNTILRQRKRAGVKNTVASLITAKVSAWKRNGQS